MKIRLGVCSDCGARYKIPVSFAADRARCKQCGGTTEIGPPVEDPDALAPAAAPAKAAAPAPPIAKPAPPKVAPPKVPAPAPQSSAPKPLPAKPVAPRAPEPKKAQPAAAKPAAPAPRPQPAAKPAPAPARAATPQPAAKPQPARLEEVVGSGKKSDGPSMKERLLAQRRAAAETSAPTPPAARPAASASPAKAKTPPPAAKPARAVAAAAPTSPRGAARPTTKRKSEAEVEDDGGRAGRRGGGHARGRKKQSPVPMIVGGGLLLVAGGAIFAYSNYQKGVAAKAKADEEAAKVVQATDTPAADTNAPVTTVPATNGTTPVTPEAAPESTPAAEVAASVPTEAAPDEASAPKPKPSADQAKDPASIDLTQYADFGPLPGCSQERFDELTEAMATFVDPAAGAAGNRARKVLFEADRDAFPVIINAMRKQDYATQQGYLNGDVAQTLLREMLGGMSFGWKYSTEPGDVYFNKKAVELYIKEATKLAENPDYWQTLTKKRAGKEAATEKPEEGLDKEAQDALDALDDL